MRIAVIGSGISGLTAAWLLSRRHEVTLIEARPRLGGHTHTVVHRSAGTDLALDTGFIVFNHETYPHFTRLLEELGVEARTSDMSFAVSCANPDVEYAVHSLAGLFARRRHLVSPQFYRLVTDILRFGPAGRAALTRPDPAVTVAEFVAAARLSETFAQLYLLPIVGAIWSSGSVDAAAFPRDALLRFFANHGLLQVRGQPQWYTVRGGSHRYLGPITRPLGERIRLGLPVQALRRGPRGVSVAFADESTESFDAAVVATHADQALAMLERPSDAERELLGAWTYSKNDTWLHTDIRLMPRRRSAWASWNTLVEDLDRPSAGVAVSYHLNRLQGLDTAEDYLVTLNPPQPPNPQRVLRRMTYHHPVYTRESLATQADLPALNGVDRTWYCGAHFGHGFHEDGVASAVAVAEDLGVSWP